MKLWGYFSLVDKFDHAVFKFPSETSNSISHFQEMIKQIPLSFLISTFILLLVSTPVTARSKKCIRYPKLPACRGHQGDSKTGVSAGERMRKIQPESQESQDRGPRNGGDVLCQARPTLCRRGKSAAAGKV